ncbi:MAG: dihydrolipoamide acetyltransferase family protein [Armatimonadota bacterium]
MATAIRMPDMGTTVEDFTIIAWRVNEGDTVALGDMLADIETDKAVAELESTTAGTVLKILIEAGEMAHTGDVLAYIGAAGETISEEAAAPPVEVAAPSLPSTPAPANTTIQVAPVVRNLAAKLGVDLATIQGTGPRGLITREDVVRASQSIPVISADTLSRNQSAVARAVKQSWTEIPHTYFTAEIDMTAAQELRARSKADGVPISYDAMLLAAMARAVTAMPAVAAHLDGERVIAAQGIHLALAVELNEDLLLPVIRDVDTLALPALQAEITAIIEQLQGNRLPQARLSGGCLALSNLGMYPLESFDPIIFPGHSAMLATGGIRQTPVVLDGQIVIRPLMKATLAVDHRLINGRAAAEFLTQIKTAMEAGMLEAIL